MPLVTTDKAVVFIRRNDAYKLFSAPSGFLQPLEGQLAWELEGHPVDIVLGTAITELKEELFGADRTLDGIQFLDTLGLSVRYFNNFSLPTCEFVSPVKVPYTREQLIGMIQDNPSKDASEHTQEYWVFDYSSPQAIKASLKQVGSAEKPGWFLYLPMLETIFPELSHEIALSIKMKYFENLFKDHPELLAFFTDSIDATHDYNTTAMADWMRVMYEAARVVLPEVQASLTLEPLSTLIKSVNIQGRSIELERTVLCIMAMQAVASGNYEFFSQTSTVFGSPITSKQFRQLEALLRGCFPNGEIKILLHELVLGDLGKVRVLREALYRTFNLTQQDPDQFLSALLKLGHDTLRQVLPGIASLSAAEHEELVKVNTEFHYGHFAHTESTERELQKLQLTLKVRGMRYLYKNMLVQVFDVAGAAAQDGGKILLNQSIASTYLDDMLPALLRLGSMAPEKVYTQYMAKRLQVCGLLPPGSFSRILSPQERLLGRLACMFRIYKKDDLVILQAALEKLFLDSIFLRNVKALDDYQLQENLQTPTYMPALLNALKTSPRIMELAKESEDNPQVIALRIGLQLIGNTLSAHQRLVADRKLTPDNPVNFNALTGLVKNDFDAIKTLCITQDIAFEKNSGIALPTTWVTTHKPISELDDLYVASSGNFKRGTCAATAIQFWYRRTRDENKALEMIANREKSPLAQQILSRRA